MDQHNDNGNDDNNDDNDDRPKRLCKGQPKVDQFMGQLTQDNLVGTGTYGVVYKVQCPKTSEYYALKVATLLDGDDSSVWDNEIKYLKKASSRYVANYYDHQVIDGQLFIVMDYSAGSFRKLLAAKPGICRRQTGDPVSKPEFYLTGMLFNMALEAVEHIHGLDPQIIHRDIRPDNMLIEFNGFDNSYVKLIDFGIATHHYRSGDNWKHTTDQGCGHYTAPEVVNGLPYDHRSDIYSLSIVGAELFGIDLDVLIAKDATRLRPGVYCRERLEKLFYWLCRMNSPNPADRPECTEVLIDYGNWNFSMVDIMITWMANYNHIYQKLVPPLKEGQSNEENILVRSGLDRHASLQQVIDMLAEEKWSKLLDAFLATLSLFVLWDTCLGQYSSTYRHRDDDDKKPYEFNDAEMTAIQAIVAFREVIGELLQKVGFNLPSLASIITRSDMNHVKAPVRVQAAAQTLEAADSVVKSTGIAGALLRGMAISLPLLIPMATQIRRMSNEPTVPPYIPAIPFIPDPYYNRALHRRRGRRSVMGVSRSSLLSTPSYTDTDAYRLRQLEAIISKIESLHRQYNSK
ncbi:dual specificity protein kinase shkD-like [Oppia nitens]|uniref:dual specificity protein kinase shkD-like n=1 Tax=Oppia nitens TaxID=1686743 RepID=UPI0023D9D2AD|nr:dual specificity protein kinase shkD-like [Oppia nitens]